MPDYGLFHGDDAQLDALVGYLVFTHGIPRYRVKKNWHVLLDSDTFRIVGFFDRLGHNVFGGTVSHCPDIVLLDEGCRRILLLIELDGSSHDKRASRKKTLLRNGRYRKAGIPHTVINIRHFRDSGKDWFAHLDRELARRGICTKSAGRCCNYDGDAGSSSSSSSSSSNSSSNIK